MTAYKTSDLFPNKTVRHGEVLHGKSHTDQEPKGLGDSNKIQIEFGAEQTSADGCLKIHTDGTIEKLSKCTAREVNITIRLGSSGLIGRCIIVGWLEVAEDGTNFSQPVDSDTAIIEMDTTDQVTRQVFHVGLPEDLPVGAKLRVFMARDPSGANFGGLYAKAPTGSLGGLNGSPSAEVEISALEV